MPDQPIQPLDADTLARQLAHILRHGEGPRADELRAALLPIKATPTIDLNEGS